jgi:hypothetical protein
MRIQKDPSRADDRAACEQGYRTDEDGYFLHNRAEAPSRSQQLILTSLGPQLCLLI